MRRLNGILGVCLVGQLVLFGTVLVFCGPESNRIEPVALLAGVEADGVTRIRLAGKTGQTEEEVVLERRDAGWVLPAEAAYPASADKVDGLLATVTGLTSSRIVARGPEHRVDLKVAEDEFQRRITLVTDAGERTIWVGTGAGGTTCVRTDVREETFGTDEIKVWDLSTRIRDWYVQPYLEVPTDRLAEITITGKQGELSLTRTSLANWSMADQQVPAEALDDLLDQLERIEHEKVEGKASDPASGAALEGGGAYRIVLGLTAEPLPPTVPVSTPEPTGPKAGVPDPEPIGTPPAAETAPPTAAAAEPALPPPAAGPQIAERIRLTIAGTDDSSDRLLVLVDGRDHVVRVPRYKLDKVLEADPAKLTGQIP